MKGIHKKCLVILTTLTPLIFQNLYKCNTSRNDIAKNFKYDFKIVFQALFTHWGFGIIIFRNDSILQKKFFFYRMFIYILNFVRLFEISVFILTLCFTLNANFHLICYFLPLDFWFYWKCSKHLESDAYTLTRYVKSISNFLRHKES